MIYTIKSGDTLFNIANNFDIPLNELIEINGITNADNLSIGQNLYIPTDTNTYTIASGDTLYLIARRYGISLDQLIRLNPQITNPNNLQVGQEINLNVKRDIDVNGYAVVPISENTLDKALPFLTYASFFSYQALSDGNLTSLMDTSLISQTKGRDVAPIMVVTNIGSSKGFERDISHDILKSTSNQNNLINNIISILTTKSYAGVNMDFEYLYPEDRDNYIALLTSLKNRLVEIGRILIVSVPPKSSDNQQGTIYEGFDYQAIGKVADRVIIMTYEWGYIYGEPMAISPLNEVEKVLNYAVQRIPSDIILMGMPNYAYDWIIPYRQGTSATTLTNTQALTLAQQNNAEIRYDNVSQSPYFNYTKDSVRHVVWFDDARSISTRLSLIDKYNLGGVSYWTINNYNAVNWFILSDMFNINKIGQ